MARGMRPSPAILIVALGDVLGEIADPFEIGGNAQRADDLAQVDGDRLAAGDDRDGFLLDRALQRVEPGVGGDDLLRQFGVHAGQRVHGVGEHLFGDAAHFGNMAAEQFKLGVEGFDGVFDHAEQSLARQPKRPVM